jgi:hypothetical protein
MDGLVMAADAVDLPGESGRACACLPAMAVFSVAPPQNFDADADFPASGRHTVTLRIN